MRKSVRSACSPLPPKETAGYVEGADRLRKNSCPIHGVQARRPLITVACHEDLTASDLRAGTS